MADARRLYPDFDLTRTWTFPPALLDAHPIHADDEPFDAYLRRLGLSNVQIEYARRSYVNATGEAIHRLSARAALEDMADARFGSGDYRIVEGYDSLHQAWARGLDIRFNTAITELGWNRAGVRAIAADGTIFDAERVVITLPLAVLQASLRGEADVICFDPALPADKRGAIAALCMAPAVKLVYRFRQPIAAPQIAALYSARNPPMWWSPQTGVDTDGEAVWIAFTTGDYARELRALGEAGALAHGLNMLRAELNRPDLQPDDMRWSDWASDPFARGGYSAVPVGATWARAVLAQPTDGVMFWAGEATVDGAAAGTVHGAYLSGIRASREVMSAES
ncbi:MAG: NAD(P)/FAD-dependent oxidoreductase [Chloroflexota bacterium]|nr:NAD(P)/FAD-dependent oxidoreductase [Chloroflexota bacterium]